MLAIIFGRYFHHKYSHTEPEEREEAVEGRVCTVGVVSIKCL